MPTSPRDLNVPYRRHHSEATAELKLRYVTGRAYGLSAKVPVLVLPITIDPTPDTGEVRTADAKTVTPACTQNINVVVLTADALTVNAVHVTGLGGVDVVVASSTSGAHNCA